MGKDENEISDFCLPMLSEYTIELTSIYVKNILKLYNWEV